MCSPAWERWGGGMNDRVRRRKRTRAGTWGSKFGTLGCEDWERITLDSSVHIGVDSIHARQQILKRGNLGSIAGSAKFVLFPVVVVVAVYTDFRVLRTRGREFAAHPV